MNSDRPSFAAASTGGPDAPPERERRQRVLKGASILSGIENSEIACAVHNMHTKGAELKVPVEIPVPQEFLLYVPVDGVAYQCTVRWRKMDRVGVEISGTAPKPTWHYG